MSTLESAGLSAAVDARLDFAGQLFEAIRERSKDVEGVTRPAWSSRARLDYHWG